MTNAIILLIQFAGQLVTILVLLHSVANLLLPPTNRFRQLIERLVEPMLNPIRKLVKPYRGIDFAPLVLLLLIMLVIWALPRLVLAISR